MTTPRRFRLGLAARGVVPPPPTHGPSAERDRAVAGALQA